MTLTVSVDGLPAELADAMVDQLAVLITQNLRWSAPFEIKMAPLVGPAPPLPPEPSAPGAGGFVCPECGKSFRTGNAMGGHRSRAHRAARPVVEDVPAPEPDASDEPVDAPAAELPPPVVDQVVAELPHQCGACPRRFPTAHGLAVHFGREHKTHPVVVEDVPRPPMPVPSSRLEDPAMRVCVCGHSARRHEDNDGECLVAGGTDECTAFRIESVA